MLATPLQFDTNLNMKQACKYRNTNIIWYLHLALMENFPDFITNVEIVFQSFRSLICQLKLFRKPKLAGTKFVNDWLG
jgi:hypothetical protein